MKKIIVVVFVSLLILSACNRSNKKTSENPQDSVSHILSNDVEELQDLSEVITRFVRAYASQDEAKLNSLLHAELGLTIIYRPGASDNFITVDSIDLAHPVPDYYPYPSLENTYALTFGSLPKFDCGTEKWDKQGLVCDTTIHPTQLTQIALFEKEFNEATYSRVALEEIRNRENASFRVIVTAKNPLVFHVQKYKGRWYVSVLDRAYGGCDA